MKPQLKILLLLSLTIASTPSFSGPMYGAVSMGNAKEADLSGNAQVAQGSSVSLTFGYHLNRNLAYEVTYSELFNNADISNSTLKKTLKGFELGGVANLPLSENFSILAKLAYTNADPYYSSGPLVSNLVGFVYGAGAQYDINETFSVRTGMNIYNLSGMSGDAIVNNSYASVLYNF